MNRAEIFAAIQSKIEGELNELNSSLEALISDLGNETKSSAGDKYETAREMIQQEREQLEGTKQNKLLQLAQLNRLRDKNASKISEAGSIIETNHGFFLLGVSFGKIDLTEAVHLFGLGLQSPLSQHLLGKTKGEESTVNGRTYEILNIR